jgi:hypothetical protein
VEPAAAPDLLTRLERVGGLDRRAAERLVAECLAYWSETPEAWVARRHAELQAEGLANDAIFARIAAELPERRFTSPPRSARQLRRLVYG